MPATAEPEPAKLTAMTFRPDNPELFDALDEYRQLIRRSRNMAIVLLLEEILTSKGLWPRKKK